MTGTTRHSTPSTTNSAALTVRVDNLTDSVAKLSSKMDHAASAEDVRALSIKIDKLSQPSAPQYSTWLAAAAFVTSIMVGFFTLGISPIKEAIAKNDAETRIAIEKVEATAKAARSEISAELKDMRTAVVSRGEHEQRWRSLENTDTVLGARIDETRKTLAELYSPKDAFKEMQQQINDLRAVISRLKQ